jgi:hypothetical protein
MSSLHGSAIAEAFGHFEYPTPPLGRSKADVLEVLDQEKGLALALAETLTEAREKVTGPAAGRYRAAAAEFSHRYVGTYPGKRELRALVANPRLQVYEDPKAFLTCDHDAFTALCNPDRGRARDGNRATPDHSRCRPACTNISRTNSQIYDALRSEAARIDADAEAGLDPCPIAAREQQRKVHLTEIIRRHEAQPQPAPTPRNAMTAPAPDASPHRAADLALQLHRHPVPGPGDGMTGVRAMSDLAWVPQSCTLPRSGRCGWRRGTRCSRSG